MPSPIGYSTYGRLYTWHNIIMNNTMLHCIMPRTECIFWVWQSWKERMTFWHMTKRIHVAKTTHYSLFWHHCFGGNANYLQITQTQFSQKPKAWTGKQLEWLWHGSTDNRLNVVAARHLVWQHTLRPPAKPGKSHWAIFRHQTVAVL